MSPAGEETFGQRLARLGKAAGLSQEQLAKHLDTTQTLISEYEHDSRRVHGERLSTIARLLHVNVDELLGHKPSKANGELEVGAAPQSNLSTAAATTEVRTANTRCFIARFHTQ